MECKRTAMKKIQVFALTWFQISVMLLLCQHLSAGGCELGISPSILDQPALICEGDNYQIAEIDSLPASPYGYEWLISNEAGNIAGFSFGLFLNLANYSSGSYCLSPIIYQGDENPIDKSEVVYGTTSTDYILEQIDAGACAGFDPEACFAITISPALIFEEAAFQCNDSLGWFGSIAISNGSGSYSSDLEVTHQFDEQNLVFGGTAEEWLDFTITDLETGCSSELSLANPCLCSSEMQELSILQYERCAGDPFLAEWIPHDIDSTEVFYYLLLSDSIPSQESVLTFSSTGAFNLDVINQTPLYLTTIAGPLETSSLPDFEDDCTLINSVATINTYAPIEVNYNASCTGIDFGPNCEIWPGFDLTISAFSEYAAASNTGIEVNSDFGFTGSIATGQVIVVNDLIYSAGSTLLFTDELGCQLELAIAAPCAPSTLEGLAHAGDLPADSLFICNGLPVESETTCFFNNVAESISTYILYSGEIADPDVIAHEPEGNFSPSLLESYLGETLWLAAAVYPLSSSGEIDLEDTPLAVGSPAPVLLLNPLDLQFEASDCENQMAEVEIFINGGAPEVSSNFIYSLNGDLQMGVEPGEELSIQLEEGQSIQLFLNDGTGCVLEYNFGPLECATSLDEIMQAPVAIFPQPADQYLHVSIPVGSSQIAIHNISGQMLWQIDENIMNQGLLRLNSLNWTPGLYLLSWTLDQKKYSQRFVIE